MRSREMRVSPLAGCKARFLPGMSFPTLCKAQVFPSSAGRIPREGEERLPRADKSPPKQAAGEEDPKQPPPGGRGMSFASPYFTWRNASICLSPPDERAGPREGKKRHPPRRHPASRLQQGQQRPPLPPPPPGEWARQGGKDMGRPACWVEGGRERLRRTSAAQKTHLGLNIISVSVRIATTQTRDYLFSGLLLAEGLRCGKGLE